MRIGDRDAWIPAAAALLLFVVCSPSQNHYWDEYFYLFSASRHSPAALVSMEPALADGIFPNGFFSGKLGFVTMLHGVLAVTGTGTAGITAARVAFVLLTIALALASWLLLRQLLADRRTARLAAAIVLVSPLSVYLGFKVLAEVPALVVATLAGWQLARAAHAGAPGARWSALALSGVGFGGGILMRLTSVLLGAGLVAALVVVRPGGATRRRILADGIIALAIAGIVAGAVYALAIGSPVQRMGALAASVTSRAPGGLVAVYAVALFAQLFAPILVVALWPPLARPTKAALLWLAVAIAPYLLAAEYVEPRFFYTGLIPFAMLAAVGLDRLAARLPTASRTIGWVGLLVAIVLGNRLALAPLMPYELREREYAGLVAEVRERQPGATLVAPWISDYCYLATAFPSQRSALAMSRSYGTDAVFSSPEFRAWIGPGHYVSNTEDLGVLPAPQVYVGWEYSPTIGALDAVLRPIGIAYLDDPDRRSQLLNHLTPSWIWDSPHLRLDPLAERGPYRAFTIEERRP